MMKKPITQLSRKSVYDNPRTTLYEDTIRLENGKQSTYLVADFHDAVFVIAENAQNEIALVTQYRYPIETFTIELIAGMLEPNTDPITQVRRELHEEANLIATSITHTGSFYMKPSRAVNKGYVFHASITDSSSAHTSNQEADESIKKVQFCSYEQILNMVANGSISDAYNLAALHLFFAKKSLKTSSL